MYKVTYDTKNSTGHLISITKKFDNFRGAMNFVRSLQHVTNVVGKPILERV